MALGSGLWALGSGLWALGSGPSLAQTVPGKAMGRDHRKLRVFHLADDLVLQIYHMTGNFPVAERFGLQAQLRRAAVSAAGNIVEGCARRTTGEYVNLLSVANGSAAEVRYLADLSRRLGFASEEAASRIVDLYSELMKGLQRLIASLDA